MWTAVLCCAALGALLSLRFKAFALAPASVLGAGASVVYGLIHEWGPLVLVLLTLANLSILQLVYGLLGLVLQVAGIKQTEPRKFGPLHNHYGR
jgi:hypothetical protein